MSTAIELSSNNNPFRDLFYQESSQFNVSGIKAKTRFLGNFILVLKELSDDSFNQSQNESYATMASALTTTVAIYSAFLINPVITAPLALVSLVSFGFNLKAKFQKERIEKPVLSKLQKYNLLLNQVPLEQLAILWETSGTELFLEALNIGISQGKYSNAFNNVATYLASCHRLDLKSFQRELSAVKAGKTSTLLTAHTPLESTQVQDLSVADAIQPLSSPMVIQPVQSESVIDIPTEIAKSLKLTLIVGTPGSGKGIFITNALHQLKKLKQDVKVFYLDPKKEPKEDGYFENGLIDFPFRIDMFAPPEEFKKWLDDAIKQYESYQTDSVKVLIVDELTNTLERLGQIGDKEAKGFGSKLTAYASSGDSRGMVVWGINQSAHALPGFGGGTRSMFTPVFIVDGRNLSAAEGLLAAKMISKDSKPSPQELKNLCDRSPVNRAIYYGGTDQWYPMPRMTNFSGYDRDSRTFLQGTQTKIQPVCDDYKVSPQVISQLEKNLNAESVLSEDAQRLLSFFESAKNKTPKTLADIRKKDVFRVLKEVKLINLLQELVQAEKLIFDSDNEAWSKSDW